MNQIIPGFIHTAEKGDNLYLLGKKYDVPVSAILYGNPCMNAYNIQKGDQIFIPGKRKILKKM